MDMRKGDVLGMEVTSNSGEFVQDTTLCKPGAKDGLSGTNVTEPFQPAAVAIPKPLGGGKDGFNMK